MKLFTDNLQIISGLELGIEDNSIPNKLLLGISKQENNELNNLITNNPNLINPHFFLKSLFLDKIELVSNENHKYKKYKIGIVAENIDNKLQFFLPVNDIFIYSLDNRFHFSKSYSEFFKDEIKHIQTNKPFDNLIKMI